MKKSILALCALSLAAGLSACGGGTSSYTIGGTVTGLQYDGLVLQNNLGNDLPITAEKERDANGNVKNVPYSFPGQLEYGKPYSVTVKTPPAHQKCNLGANAADTAGRLSTINIVISCALVANKVSGTIEGLAADKLTLNNGSDQLTIIKDDKGVYPGTFEFNTAVEYGQTYGVTVLSSAEGQRCEVLADPATGKSTGIGTMGDNPVDSVKIRCTPI